MGYQRSTNVSVVNRILRAVHDDILFVIWWMQNLLDFLSTKIAVETERAIELNILINRLGGPLAMPSIILKMLIAPVITYLSYSVFKQHWGKWWMIVANLAYLVILTNNVLCLASS